MSRNPHSLRPTAQGNGSPEGTPVDALRHRIETNRALVGVIGLGHVGLPVALAFAEKGFPVIGFEADPERVEALAAGGDRLAGLSAALVRAVSEAERFTVTGDLSRLAEPDAILICVPTPLHPTREPDMSFVRQAAEAVRSSLRPGQLVVLESTTYPGTTDELLRPELERSGLACGRDFFLAYSPERIDPGNRRFAVAQIPRLVGGVDEVSAALAQGLYDRAFAATVRVSSARAAEAAKLTENVFRAVNIALVNELKVVYESMGIDIWEVLDAAATKPFGFMRFEPGPGWGGHCIPVDPFYLAWKAREQGTAARFIELAGEVNVEMPRHVIARLEEALTQRGKPVKGSRVLVLGIAYKRDVADVRESPAFEAMNLLRRLGAEVAYHDPHLPQAPSMRSWPELPPMRSQPLTPEVLEAQDAVLLITDHSAVDYELVRRHAALLVDTRGVFREGGANLVRA